MLEAAVMQLGNKSAQGDLRAAREFFSLVQRSEESVNSSSGPIELSDLDQPVLENLRRRLAKFQPLQEEKEKSN